MPDAIRTLAFAPRSLVQSRLRSFSERAELIQGYGDHNWELNDHFVGILPIYLNKIRQVVLHVSNSFKPSFRLRPIVEIQVLGHADRSWKIGVLGGARNTADEDLVSQKRADDIWAHMRRDLVQLNFQIDEFISDGVIQLIVVGLGARQLLASNKNAAPENRRVEILLLSKKSITL